MSKKVVKIVNVVLIVLILISVATSVMAIDPGQITGASNVLGTSQITNAGQSIVGILQTVGVILSVIVLIVLGIKYMMGSAEEKAEYKKSMIPYIVGAALIFAASVFANIVYQFFFNISV